MVVVTVKEDALVECEGLELGRVSWSEGRGVWVGLEEAARGSSKDCGVGAEVGWTMDGGDDDGMDEAVDEAGCTVMGGVGPGGDEGEVGVREVREGFVEIGFVEVDVVLDWI